MSEWQVAGDPVLVPADWLAANLGKPGLRIVDVRGVVRPPGIEPRYLPKRDEYEAGHVPGAVFVDWTRDIVDQADPVPAQLAKPDAFAEAMGVLGIGDDTLVIAYDDHDHVFAGRLSWALRYYGHDAVRVLDGGWPRWLAEGRPTTREEPLFSRAIFTARPRPSLRRTADDVMRSLGSDDVLLIDARAPAQYTGEQNVGKRGGHIPGARNVHYARLIDAATGKLASLGELRAAFADAGVDVASLPRDVIVYCNGGVSCTVPLNALRILGRDDAAVYDGSWNEWGNDEARPIRVGREP